MYQIKRQHFGGNVILSMSYCSVDNVEVENKYQQFSVLKSRVWYVEHIYLCSVCILQCSCRNCSYLGFCKLCTTCVSFCVENRDLNASELQGQTTENVEQMLDLHTMNSNLSTPIYTDVPSITTFSYSFQFSIIKFAFMLSTPKS